MKILHTGDIHLDSPFSSSDPKKSEQQRRELRSTFSEMMDFAVKEKVDLVLIAGDLFDCSFATKETVALLVSEFSKLPCPVIISPGNHDPADEKSIWKKKIFPDNVYIFDEETVSTFDFDDIGCTVYGFAFTSPFMRTCPIDGKAAADRSRINILCAHGDTASPVSSYCPITPAALRAFGADYAALAHIHCPEAANLALGEKELAAAYCGCPQGRDFGETGVKGARLVTITKNGDTSDVSSVFVPFSKKVYMTADVFVDGAQSMAEVISELRAFISCGEYDENTLLSVTLKGFVSSSLVILTEEVEKECSDGLYCLVVNDGTVLSLGGDELKSDKGIRGEVYRLLLPKIENGTPEERGDAIRALRYALAALAGEPLI